MKNETLIPICLIAILAVSLVLFYRRESSLRGQTLQTDEQTNEHQKGAYEEKKLINNPAPGQKVTIGEVVENTNGEKVAKAETHDDASGKDKVVKQKSSLDQQYYFVAASLPDKVTAANKLAEMHRRAQYLLQAIDEDLDNNGRIIADDNVDITDNMRALLKKHYNKKVTFGEYYNPHDKTVGSNAEKGIVLEVCLRSKYNPNEWNTDNTLFRVYTHELAHSADHDFRGDGDEAHGPDFRRIHNYLLKLSAVLGIYSCREYAESKQSFCGSQLTERDDFCM